MKEASAAPEKIIAAETKPKTRSQQTSKAKNSDAITEKASPTHHHKIVAQTVPEPAKAPEKREVKREQIAEVAYYHWLSRGGAPGNPEEDWLRAERQLTAKA